MALKTYRCNDFPQLIIAGVCQFKNHELSTSSLIVQSKIEQSQSFISGIVKLEENESAVESEDVVDVTAADLRMFKKAQLVDLADQLGIDYGEKATRADLLSLCAAELRRNEE